MVINVEGWKSKGERGPLAQFAPHIDRSPVCLAGVLNERQSQAGSTVFPGTGVVHPIEPFENTLLVSLANTDSVVGDGDCDDVGVDVTDSPGGDHYPGLWFGIDNGVVNKIGDCFGEWL